AAWLRVLSLLALVAVAARVVQLQAFPGADLRAAIDARTSGSRLEPVRGDLLDRRGRVLATSRTGWRVIVDPVAAGDQTDRVIVELAARLGANADQVGARVMRAAVENLRRRESRDPAEPAEPARADAGSGLRAWLADVG